MSFLGGDFSFMKVPSCRLKERKTLVPLSEVKQLKKQIRELERLLGKKTIEFEILKDALGEKAVKNSLSLTIISKEVYPMKRITETFHISRSNSTCYQANCICMI